MIFYKVKNEIACDSPGIRLLAPTRWTVHSTALTSISENYTALRETWALVKQASSDSEMRARIGGVANQMESLDFLFGVELGRKVLNMADNLSKALQGATVSASEGHTLMKMTITALASIRTYDSISFWKLVDLRRQEYGVDDAKLL